MSSGPNPAVAGWSMVRARRLSSPQPDTAASRTVDHSGLVPVLEELEASGVASLSNNIPALDTYRDTMESEEPNTLDPAEALAFWMNLYNAGALRTAAAAFDQDSASVLRVPGAFSDPWAVIAGEILSLDDIEHGKIRRFRDPRIHGALVCGSASCPTLRGEPYVGARLDVQLDDQLRIFITHGAAQVSRSDNTLWLSSVFKWYGGDFTRPYTMPNLTPALPERLRNTIAFWMSRDDADYIWVSQPKVKFMPYDWALGCSISRS
ncbi:MAG: DUF547 domain-containing protein [Actinomycetia bacterium]|nr:DUF547 domain-containing protein [Actinomycetes bacterium]